MAVSSLQATIYQGYGTAAAILGQPFDQYRPLAASTPIVLGNQIATAISAQFTSGKTAGFNFDKSLNYDDVLVAGMFNATNFEVGDYLVNEASGQTVFVAAMDNLLPVLCVRCNQTIALSRPNSQVAPSGGSSGGMPSQQGGPGTYWGSNRTPVTNTTAIGEDEIVSGVPCAVVATAGRATGTGEDPSGSAGPTRWKFYLPQSVFPKGSVRDGDIIINQETYRHMVSAAAWTPLGYRAETVRQEVQG